MIHRYPRHIPCGSIGDSGAFWNNRTMTQVDFLLRRVLLKLVHGYQKWFGWLLGGHCRFVPSCSCYAEEALQRGPAWKAIPLVIWRLLRCHPLCKGGFDPVPENLPKEGPEIIELDSDEKQKKTSQPAKDRPQ